ncbi:MAG TPA: carbohydrate binding domain-containing protein [Candidatus Limnocylindrales bacterium]|nr:carbohydrate binding domain-containing protein [Candidatus Limnocylindrales bacterium]
MRTPPLTRLGSPESIASILVGLVAVAVMASQVVAGPGAIQRPPIAPDATASTLPVTTIPPIIRSSLATILVVNERLATRADELAQTAAVNRPVAEDIAAGLRGINTEMAVANEAADRLLTTDETAALGVDLVAFYDAVAARNAETLGTSIRNARAYVDGAKQVVEILGGLAALNERVQAALDDPVVAASASPTASPTPSPSPTATPPPTAAPPTVPPAGSPGAADGGLIANGGFESGLDGWQLIVVSPARATLTGEPGAGVRQSAAARVDIAAGSDARTGIALTSTGMGLRQGAAYTVSLAVRSAEAREIRVRLAGGGDLTYVARVFTVGTSWTVLTFDVSQLVTDPAARLSIDLGRSAATVWFDDVSVREQGG